MMIFMQPAACLKEVFILLKKQKPWNHGGLKLVQAKSKGLNFIQVETDSLQTFNELTASSNTSSSSLLIDDVKDLVKSFEHVTFLFAK